MPCIQIKTSVKVTEEAANTLKKELGQMITCLPGKTEDWLMVTLEDECRMWFRGETGKPIAFVDVKVFGNRIDPAGSEQMTEQVCKLFQETLGVDPKDLYIRYTASPHWGWNGSNF